MKNDFAATVKNAPPAIFFALHVAELVLDTATVNAMWTNTYTTPTSDAAAIQGKGNPSCCCTPKRRIYTGGNTWEVHRGLLWSDTHAVAPGLLGDSRDGGAQRHCHCRTHAKRMHRLCAGLERHHIVRGHNRGRASIAVAWLPADCYIPCLKRPCHG